MEIKFLLPAHSHVQMTIQTKWTGTVLLQAYTAIQLKLFTTAAIENIYTIPNVSSKILVRNRSREAQSLVKNQKVGTMNLFASQSRPSLGKIDIGSQNLCS